MTPLRVLAALVAMVLAAPPGHALVLCRQKGGHLVARDVCRRRERPVDMATLGPLGPVGAAGAPGTAGAPGRHPLRLVDGTDKEIGAILHFSPTSVFVEIRSPLLGRPVTFIAEPAGFRRFANDEIVYDTGDCSGIPYIRPNRTGDQVIAQVCGDYAYVSTDEASSRTHGSREVDAEGLPCGPGAWATGRGTCCYADTGSVSLQPAVRVAISALGFTPPFRAVPR